MIRRKVSFIIFNIVFGIVAVCSFCEAQSSKHTCKFSSENCDYYRCKEREIQCGPRGYLMFYGHYYCEAYLKHTPQMSSLGQRWLYGVRLCLQQRAEKLTQSTHDCHAIRQQAIASHVECYVNTGYCQLSDFDKFQIKAIAAQETLRSGSIWESLKTLNLINRGCEQ